MHFTCLRRLALAAAAFCFASAPTNGQLAWVLDNADPSFYSGDTLSLLNYEKGTILASTSDIGTSGTIGAWHALAASPDQEAVYVCDWASGRLVKYDNSLTVEWSSAIDNVHSIDVSRNGVLYVVAINYVFSVDPVDGQVLAEAWVPGALDLVVDDEGGAIWVVGRDIRKLTLDLQPVLSVDPITWYAVSVDLTSDGSVWVAARGIDRLYHVTSDGTLSKIVYPSIEPMSVSVDRMDDSVWAAGFGGILKFDSEGNQILSLSGDAFSIRVDPIDGSAWAAGWHPWIRRYSRDGTLMRPESTLRFSGDIAWIVPTGSQGY